MSSILKAKLDGKVIYFNNKRLNHNDLIVVIFPIHINYPLITANLKMPQSVEKKIHPKLGVNLEAKDDNLEMTGFITNIAPSTDKEYIDVQVEIYNPQVFSINQLLALIKNPMADAKIKVSSVKLKDKIFENLKKRISI